MYVHVICTYSEVGLYWPFIQCLTESKSIILFAFSGSPALVALFRRGDRCHFIDTSLLVVLYVVCTRILGF